MLLWFEKKTCTKNNPCAIKRASPYYQFFFYLESYLNINNRMLLCFMVQISQHLVQNFKKNTESQIFRLLMEMRSRHNTESSQ